MLSKQKYNSYCDEHQKVVYQKMSNNSWLKDEVTCKNFMLWVTFWRRNMHLFITDYLGIKLYLYQSIFLAFMGRYVDVCIIGSRAIAKSLMMAIYAVAKCILYPGTEFVITANRQKQAKLILTEKIEGILMQRSAVLRREVKSISTNDRDLSCKFHNGSKILFVICNDDSRGFRSTANGAEEAREINKKKYDEIVSPFKVVRNVPYLMTDEYKGMTELLEQPQTIMISSSVADKHWLYKYALDTAKNMIKEKSSVFLACDISVTLEHGIRTMEQLEEEKRKIDPVSWLVEYENAVLRENTNAFFPYELVTENQRLSHAFYPHGKQKIQGQRRLKRQDGEIRIVSCDLAFVNRRGNDRSAFTCIRMLPENDGSIYTYRLQVPYIESFMGQETSKQALRIRQIYEDFEADYIVLDTRNNGVAVYESLARTMFDEERGTEYSPLKCFNDDEFANRIVVPNAKPVIYCVFASQKKNSDAAYTLYSLFRERKIDLLNGRRQAVDLLSGVYPEYRDGSPEVQLCYEEPFIESDFAVGEITNLEVERLDTTGVLKIKEKSGCLKDRYSSLSMGCQFAVDLARDLNNAEEIDLDTDFDECVSEINFDVRW